MKIDKAVPHPSHHFQIEKGIKIPSKRVSKVIPLEFQAMEPGDSIWVHRDQIGRVRDWAVRIFGCGNYATQREGDGFRMWRLEERK